MKENEYDKLLKKLILIAKEKLREKSFLFEPKALKVTLDALDKAQFEIDSMRVKSKSDIVYGYSMYKNKEYKIVLTYPSNKTSPKSILDTLLHEAIHVYLAEKGTNMKNKPHGEKFLTLYQEVQRGINPQYKTISSIPYNVFTIGDLKYLFKTTTKDEYEKCGFGTESVICPHCKTIIQTNIPYRGDITCPRCGRKF